MGKSAYIHVKRLFGGINNVFGLVRKRKPTVARRDTAECVVHEG